MSKQSRTYKRRKKHLKVRTKISGTKTCPRLNVFKSLRHIEVQLIDDVAGHTMAYSSSRILKLKNGGNIKAAKLVGQDIAKKIKAKQVKKIVFDRGGYIYHGRVKEVAEAIRKEGVKF